MEVMHYERKALIESDPQQTRDFTTDGNGDLG